jgi:hypothetical protein
MKYEKHSRLGTIVVAFGAKGLFVYAKHSSVPRKELADSVDLVSQRNMERHEVLEASSSFASHEMRLGGQAIKTLHSLDVVNLLLIFELAPRGGEMVSL